MRQLSAFRILAVAAMASLAATGCGGDDVFPRDEFVQQTVARGVKKPVAECTYDAIKSNRAIMKELNRVGGPNSDISEKVSDQLGTILARCLLAAEGDASVTTTTEKSTTKTTSKSGSSSGSSDSKRTTTTSSR